MKFQFGFSISSTRQQTPHTPENIALAASHLPDKEDTILGRNEYNQVAAAVHHFSGAPRGAFQQPVYNKCKVRWLRVLARPLQAVHNVFCLRH